MIGWLHGKLRTRHPPLLVLDVGGVGYEVEAPMTTFYDLPKAGREVSLFIHHVVRDDAQLLFGFYREGERNLFRQLIRINGVGPKMALAILSGMDAGAFARCVAEGDSAGLTSLPGVGKKTAERLIIEMRDRLQGDKTLADLTVPAGGEASPQTADARSEAVHALVALGYKALDAQKRVKAVASEGMVCEDIIRMALKSLAR